MTDRERAIRERVEAATPVLRCHGCNGAMVYKRISEGEIEVYHSCVPSPRLLCAVREGAVADELAKPVKRVIPGCAHSLDRMVVWAKEGACPICLTAELGMLKEEKPQVLAAARERNEALERERDAAVQRAERAEAALNTLCDPQNWEETYVNPEDEFESYVWRGEGDPKEIALDGALAALEQ